MRCIVAAYFSCIRPFTSTLSGQQNGFLTIWLYPQAEKAAAGLEETVNHILLTCATKKEQT